MSRSGYSEDCDGWALIRWRGAVSSSIRGKRGQQLLRETLAALDAMPVKELIAHELAKEGEYCTLGVVGKARGMDLESLDPEDREVVAGAFGIAPALAAEIVYENDECIRDEEFVSVEICGPMRCNYPDWGNHSRSVLVRSETAAHKRWVHMRNWIASNIQDSQ